MTDRFCGCSFCSQSLIEAYLSPSLSLSLSLTRTCSAGAAGVPAGGSEDTTQCREHHSQAQGQVGWKRRGDGREWFEEGGGSDVLR